MFLENKIKIRERRKQELGYAQIIVFGLNYSMKHIRSRGKWLNEIKLLFHFPINYEIEIPVGIVARAFKRRLVLCGDKKILMDFIKRFTILRKPNIYTGKGIKLKTKKYKRKPGKVGRR